MILCLALANLSLFKDKSHAMYLSLHLEEQAIIYPGTVLGPGDATMNKANKDRSPMRLLLLLGIQINKNVVLNSYKVKKETK